MNDIIKKLFGKKKSYSSLEPDEVESSHEEKHFSSPRVISDAIIGMSDGLTVPFALTAGLSSLGSTKIVITGGFAELISGAISMGLGGYLAAQSEREYFNSERKREQMEVETIPDEEGREVEGLLMEYGITKESCAAVVADLKQDREKWVDFMMCFELKLSTPEQHRAWVSALTIGLAYFIGGFIPMIPYFFVNQVYTGLWISALVTATALLVFGYVKTGVTSSWSSQQKSFMGAIYMLLIGGVAAASAFGLVRLIDR